MVTRTCKRCGETWALDNYYKHENSLGGFRTTCKPCYRAEHAEYRKRPGVAESRAAAQRRRDKAKPRGYKRDQRLLWTYNLTVEQYDEMLAAQEGRCANPGCPVEKPGGKGAWCVDHDHACCPGQRSCGKCVRGLLCSNCNVMLGNARDSIEVLEGAVKYLNARRLTDAIGPAVSGY